MDRGQAQKRAVASLMASTAVGYAGFIAAMAIAGLLAAEITGSDLLAGVPAAAGTLGTAAAAAPLAFRARRLGRRPALTFGYLIAIGGTVVAVVAGQLQIFWLLVAAMAAFGVANASNLQSRFAAADLADGEKRARACWSFALIAGSALLTESLPIEERTGAQGLADVAMSVLGATAAFSSGFVKEMVGYHWLANFATLAAILILFAVGTLVRSETRPAT